MGLLELQFEDRSGISYVLDYASEKPSAFIEFATFRTK